MDWKNYIRQKMLLDAMNNMSDEERKAYSLMQKDRQHQEVMNAIHAQDKQIDAIVQKTSRQNWWIDFGSDVLANFTTDGFIWLLSRLSRKL